MQRTIKILKSTAYLTHWKRVFEDQLHKDKPSGPDCSKVGYWLSVTKTIPGRYPGSYSSSGYGYPLLKSYGLF